jgi:acyl-CoA synthetase (AMP-forming)/AMP-acid ligase II
VSLFGVSVFGRTLVPVNFACIRRKSATSSSTPARPFFVDAELDEAPRHIPVKHRFVLGGHRPAALSSAGRKPRLHVTDENATVSINYTSGTTARPKGVQLTHRNFWLNAVTFGWHLGLSDRDVYLHTLPTFHCNGWGMPYAVTGIGARHVIIRKIDGEEILRRIAAEGVTLFNAAPAVLAAVLAAAAVRRQKGIEAPGRGRIRVVIAERPPLQDHRAHRDGAGLGVHPDLRSHRDLAAPHHQPRARGVGRAGGDGAGAPAVPRGSARGRCAHARGRRG